MSLRVEIVTPRGVAFASDGFSQVVLSRREDGFERGSEVAVRQGHGEMLVRLPRSTLRLTRDEVDMHIEVDGGFAEVRSNWVCVLTTRAGEPRTDAPACAPSREAETPDTHAPSGGQST